MDDDDKEFLALCEEIKREDWAENPSPQPPKPPPPQVELTTKQKVVVLKYVLAGPGKGLFEDCEEFWEDVPDIEAAYPSLRNAAEEYLAEVKERLIAEMCQHPNAYYYGDTDPVTYKCDDCGAVFVKG